MDREINFREGKEYKNYIHGIQRIGTATLIFLLLLTFIPGIYMCVFHDGFPGFSMILAALLTLAGAEGWAWFVEPALYFPMLGITGTYMSYAAGNITNMRIPAATAAQDVVAAKVGTQKSEIAGTIGVVSSVFVNFAVLFIVIFFGDALIKILPAIVQASFNYALPAVYGTVVAMLISRVKKN